MMSCAIDAKENRYVAAADIPGAFLHADMDEELYMLLEGKIADLIVKLNPKLYRKYIWEKKIKPMLYWYVTSSAFILEAIVGHSIGLGIQIEPI